MARLITFEPGAWNDYEYWQTQNKKVAGRIRILVKDIQRTPFIGIGKPEPLKHDKHGHWSRRIDEKNRIIYRITDEAIIIVECRYHYNDL